MGRRQPGFVLPLSAALAIAAWVVTTTTASQAQLPLEPIRDTGQSVTAAYEGWYKNADGTYSLLVGYFNRNKKEALDIPIGPNNRIEPGGPDQGQPTHFLPRRQWGVFTIVVPADFGDKKITWTIVANGRTTSVPMGLHRDYEVEPYKDAAMGNTPLSGVRVSDMSRTGRSVSGGLGRAGLRRLAGMCVCSGKHSDSKPRASASRASSSTRMA